MRKNIRPIYTDDDMYAYHYVVDAGTLKLKTLLMTSSSLAIIIKAPVIRFFIRITPPLELLLQRYHRPAFVFNHNRLASALRVSKIMEVPVMENLTRVVEDETLALKGIIVNLSDYTMGADKGGAINMFDDFDIDYNQYKYLLETRLLRH